MQRKSCSSCLFAEGRARLLLLQQPLVRVWPGPYGMSPNIESTKSGRHDRRCQSLQAAQNGGPGGMCELFLCMLIISRCTLFAATGKILAAYEHISRPLLVPGENSAGHTQSSCRGHLQFQIATPARCVHYLAAARCPPCPHPPKYQPTAAPGPADRGAASVLSPLISPEQSCRSGAEVSPLLFLYFYVFFLG